LANSGLHIKQKLTIDGVITNCTEFQQEYRSSPTSAIEFTDAIAKGKREFLAVEAAYSDRSGSPVNECWADL